MIDPVKISNFNLTSEELEENILFWVTAAGKNGITSAKLLNILLTRLKWVANDESLSPFALVRSVPDLSILVLALKTNGIGNYTMKGRAFWELAYSDLNLRTCTVNDLLKIHGIGPKTARAFLVHTRPNQRYAVIDTHLLKFFRDQGIMVPKSTPSEGRLYRELEAMYLDICDNYALSTSDLDLSIWNHYRQTPAQPFNLENYVNDYHQSTICTSCDGRG
jgi:hypothetical protein